MKLYEICAEIANCIRISDDEAVNTETGEVIDIDYLEHLNMEKRKKIEYLIKLFLNCKSNAEQLKTEADKFNKRYKAEQNKAEQLKSYLAFLQNGEKFESEDGLHKITFRKSQSVEITDFDKLDSRFIRYKEPEADKTAIKEAIKSGIKIEGAELIEKLSPQIK